MESLTHSIVLDIAKLLLMEAYFNPIQQHLRPSNVFNNIYSLFDDILHHLTIIQQLFNDYLGACRTELGGVGNSGSVCKGLGRVGRSCRTVSHPPLIIIPSRVPWPP